ncbi:hypothetical protein Chor_008298 [Crotalus horridus]
MRSFAGINNKLQQPEAASGVLEYAMKHFGELVSDPAVGQLHQQCCEKWTLVNDETQAKMARMAAAAAWGLGDRPPHPSLFRNWGRRNPWGSGLAKGALQRQSHVWLCERGSLKLLQKRQHRPEP